MVGCSRVVIVVDGRNLDMAFVFDMLEVSRSIKLHFFEDVDLLGEFRVDAFVKRLPGSLQHKLR